MSTELISALANVIMAAGIVFVAGQVFVAKRQQSTQLEIHIVELHTHFQQAIREIQKAFPPDVNNPGWCPQNQDEKRALRLYWYLVFDEWYTCMYLSKEKRLNALWTRYRYGVISALTKRSFDNEVKEMFKEQAIFFGLSENFAQEIETLRIEATNLLNAKKIESQREAEK